MRRRTGRVGNRRSIIGRRWVALVALFAFILAGCGLANPWPSIPPGASGGHQEILLVGDSMLGQAGIYLPWALGINGIDAHVTDVHVNAMGLLDPVPGDGRSVAAWFEDVMTAHPATTIVVFEFLGACSCAHTPDYGSDAFYTKWFNVAADLVQRAENHGARALWVESPPVRPDPSNNIAAVTQELAYRDSLLPAQLGTGTADWWAGFTDVNGLYQDILFYNGNWHKVRYDDGVHFAQEGEARAAIYLVAGIRAML